MSSTESLIADTKEAIATGEKRFYFQLERETKNTFRFQQIHRNYEIVDSKIAEMPTIYIRKSVFAGKAPRLLSILVEETSE